jgi:spermidine/putrescine transport system permease protein
VAGDQGEGLSRIGRHVVQIDTTGSGRSKGARPEPGKPAGEGSGWGLALLAPGVAGVACLLIVPFIIFVVYSFLSAELYDVSGPVTLDNYRNALSSPLFRALARNSAVIGLATAAATVVVGLPIAFWIRFAAGRWQTPALFLFTATLLASYLVRIYAWRTMLGTNGLLNTALLDLGVTRHPLGFLLFNRIAVTVALVHIFLPYVVLVLFAALRSIPAELLEVADDLGARPLVIWRRVILPQVAAPVATAFVFVFILASSDYVTPQFLGGTDGSMIGVDIQQAFISLGDWPLGAAMSLLTLAAFGACYALTAGSARFFTLRRSASAS